MICSSLHRGYPERLNECINKRYLRDSEQIHEQFAAAYIAYSEIIRDQSAVTDQH